MLVIVSAPIPATPERAGEEKPREEELGEDPYPASAPLIAHRFFGLSLGSGHVVHSIAHIGLYVVHHLPLVERSGKGEKKVRRFHNSVHFK